MSEEYDTALESLLYIVQQANVLLDRTDSPLMTLARLCGGLAEVWNAQGAFNVITIQAADKGELEVIHNFKGKEIATVVPLDVLYLRLEESDSVN